MHALVFTDLVDSTALVVRLGDADAARLWADHDARARALLAQHGGREIDRSDGFFLLFADVASAAAFTLGYHEACAALGVSARAGLHAGAVTLRANAPEDVARGAKPLEVEGLAKPLAARIMSVARGGQTLLSGAAAAGLQAMPAELRSHGWWRLKGLDEPVELFELNRAGAACEPPLDGAKAWRVVRIDGLWQPVRAVRHNLPPERDAFVGRAADLRALARRFEAGARLVTVLGAGGTGKTRLARRYGRAWLGDWPGGVYFCDLADARTPDGILYAVALALAVPLAQDDPAGQLAHAIAGRGRCLVILDNFEQIVAHAAATVGRWLDRAGEAGFVVTSRERLRLPGEAVHPLEPLEIATEAVPLFEARARALQPSWSPGAEERATVAEIARLLDGLPLAIELAATRITLLTPRQILARLGDRFAMLRGSSAAGSRQATLRATIDWSWQLLAAWEQAALAQAAVFEGSCSLSDCEAVIDLSTWPEAPPVIDVVQSLVEKSLLRCRHPDAAGADARYGLYASIRDYARQRLAEAPVEASEQAWRRHGEHYRRRGSDAAIDALSQAGAASLRQELLEDLDNIVGACRRALDRGDAGIAVDTFRAAWSVLRLQGPLGLAVDLGTRVEAVTQARPELQAAALLACSEAADEGGRRDAAQRCAERLLQLSEARGDPLRAGRALSQLGQIARAHGDLERARQHLDAALVHHREAADRIGEALTLQRLGAVVADCGRMDEARRHFDAALALAREHGDLRLQAGLLGSIGRTCYFTGQAEQALVAVTQALAVCRAAGDRRHEATLTINLGLLHLESGDFRGSRPWLEQALQAHRDMGHRWGEATALTNLGILATKLGEAARAEDDLEAALAIARELGDRPHEGELLGLIAGLLRDAGRHGEACTLYEQALAIQREVGNRRLEGSILGELGKARAADGRLQAALACLTEAVAIHHELGNPQEEGLHLGDLAATLAATGDLDGAEEACARGEHILRGLPHPFELARLLCQRGCLDAARGASAKAADALAEAIDLQARMGTGERSDLTRWIDRLRSELAAAISRA
ncbi:MAG: tetratricopeptide repeat protein [Rubrivivax sp.]|nr:tetratricopeptide repeat protein [Rubrivivax sp.]